MAGNLREIPFTAAAASRFADAAAFRGCGRAISD